MLLNLLIRLLKVIICLYYLVDFVIFLFYSGTADIVVNTTSELFMVLPYFRNGTLFDLLMKKAVHNEYLDVREILRMFLDVCEGLKCFHDLTPEPLAHRDLKTANICLTESLSPVIMDLGK